MQLIAHDRSGEHYARVARERRGGERFIDALKRVAISDALKSTRTQVEAAKLLGMNPVNVCQFVTREREYAVDTEVQAIKRSFA